MSRLIEPEPEKRPEGEGWAWEQFLFGGQLVWGWRRTLSQGGKK